MSMTIWGLLLSQRGVNGQLRNRLNTVRHVWCYQKAQLVKRHVKLATYNLRTCAVGGERQLELVLLAKQLSNLGIRLCGL
jgi:hypothetical protein